MQRMEEMHVVRRPVQQESRAGTRGAVRRRVDITTPRADVILELQVWE